MWIKRLLITAGLAIAVFIAYDCFYTVDESQVGVVTVFGKIEPPTRDPGLHVKWPRPISKVYKIDRRIQVLTSLSQELITEDQKNVLVDGFMMWRVTDPFTYVRAIRTNVNAVDRLRDLFLSNSGIVVSNKAVSAFVSLGLQKLEIHVPAREILERLVNVAAAEYGIEVVDVGIVEYTLPQENRPSVIARMISERARLAARYRSEGEEEAIRIEALAISAHEKIMADAHAEATTILGNAEAEAMALLGEAYREDPEFYKFIRALDSYDAIIDENTTLMLPSDNELFRYLDSKEIPLVTAIESTSDSSAE